MLELSAENAAAYVRQRGWVGPGPVEVEELPGGVSNAVLRVRTPERLFVLKQSRPQLRTRDAWFSDLERVWREMEVMQALGPHLPAGVVPEVFFCDRSHFVIAMSHAPVNAVPWKAQLLAGHVDLCRGESVGAVLGRMHQVTARDRRLVEPFADRAVFIQLRVHPYYRRVQERLPDMAAAVAPAAEQLLERRDALCHGDYSPKNMLMHAVGFTLVDYETAHWGDPAMDLGFCLSHLVLKAIKRSHDHGRHFDLTRAFWRGYHAAAGWGPGDQMEARGIAHFAVCLLARVDGTSPVEYLTEPDKCETVRRLGRWALTERPRLWEDVIHRTGSLLGGLQ